MKIAVSSIGSATAIGISKCIKKYDSNIHIIGMDLNEFGHTAGSMLVDKFYKVYRYDNDLYIEKLLEIFKDENIDMFIPIHDYEIKKVAENIEKFKNYQIVIPSLEIIDLFGDKYRATKAMNKIEIVTPQIVNNDFKDKMILRTKVSVGSVGIKVIDGKSNFTIEESQFLHEYIEGEEYTVDVFSDNNGNPVVIIPRKRVEVKAGVSTKSKLEYNRELIDICKRILCNYKIPGLCNIQFIKSNNKYYFIELNPRFAGMGISGILGGYNYIGDFLNIDKIQGSNEVLQQNLKRVNWNSIITRYYEEVVYHE